MDIGRAQKRIILYLILPAALVYFGLRFYAQFRHVDVYVSRSAPIPAELAAQLHMEEHKIDPLVTIERPYEKAEQKIFSREEIRHLRRVLAWSSGMPAFIDSLTIVSPTNVVVRQKGKRSVQEYRIVKEGERWVVESTTRSDRTYPE